MYGETARTRCVTALVTIAAGVRLRTVGRLRLAGAACLRPMEVLSVSDWPTIVLREDKASEGALLIAEPILFSLLNGLRFSFSRFLMKVERGIRFVP